MKLFFNVVGTIFCLLGLALTIRFVVMVAMLIPSDIFWTMLAAGALWLGGWAAYDIVDVCEEA